MNLIGGAYEANSKFVSAEESINLYVEVGRDAANPLSLVQVHGASLHVSLSSAIRGFHNAWGRFYAVAGNGVYRIDGTVATLLGTIPDDGLPVSMDHNIFELCIVSAGDGYVVQKATDVLTKITDVDFPESSIVYFLDGYGMLLEKNSGRFHFTTINDFETISGIDFATAEGAPDDLVSLIVDHRELWLFGTDTIEIWDNVGDSSNPFQRRPGAFIERGCRGTYSTAKLDNTVFWLGDNGVVYRADGITPIRVSNHGIETLISRTTAEPIAFTYTWDGHDFYQLNFNGEFSCVYDASTQLWHTRKRIDRLDAGYDHHVRIGTSHYVGGQDGDVYLLNGNLNKWGSLDHFRRRSAGPARSQGYASMPELELVFETGAGSATISPDQVFLEISDDSGRTFGNRIQASLGTQGQYRTEIKFLGLGGFYDNQRVHRITVTDDAPFTLVQ